MIEYKRREKRGKFMLSDTNSALINNLKGRVSKVLSYNPAILREEEKSGLEGIFCALDSLILSDRTKTDVINFKDELKLHLKFLKGTRKDAIKKRIIPVVEEVINKEWSGDE